MVEKKWNRMKNWLYVFSFVCLIYSTLYIVRPICAFLKETTPFALLVNTFMYMLLIALFVFMIKKVHIKKLSSYGILAITIFAYVYGFMVIQHPEEKIHFVEYGFLSFLIFHAIHTDIKKPIAYVYAFVLVSIFGWIDEGIQYILPNRYYQTEDVLLNCASGLLGLLLVFIANREQA